jgi:hypothetical protein
VTKDEMRKIAIRNYMMVIDEQVRNIESALMVPGGPRDDARILTDELKLWKKAQAVGLRAAQKGSDERANDRPEAEDPS